MNTLKYKLCKVILLAPEHGDKHEKQIVNTLTAMSIVAVACFTALIIG